MKAMKMMLAVLLLCFTTTVSAQYVNVRYKDGSQQIIRQSDIKKMYVNRKASGSTIVHEYVDLGLKTKWATCNIGADAPESKGLFFSWGETEGYTDVTDDKWFFSFEDYLSHSTGEDENAEGALTKYNWDPSYGNNGFVDNKWYLDREDDAATMLWGEEWRMPTQEDFDELTSYCLWTLTERNGVTGWEVKSQMVGFTDKSIFLPMTGYLWGDYEDGETMYWTSGLSDENPTWANTLYMTVEGYEIYPIYRFMGNVIRPVRR